MFYSACPRPSEIDVLFHSSLLPMLLFGPLHAPFGTQALTRKANRDAERCYGIATLGMQRQGGKKVFSFFPEHTASSWPILAPRNSLH